MFERTYISKFNTIVEGYTVNTGLNPVSELLYGSTNSRALIYFDHTKIKKMVEDKVYTDLSKLKHTLKITNAGSIDFSQMHTKEVNPIDGSTKARAASFDLIFFLIPKEWDRGKGYDYSDTFFNTNIFDVAYSDRGRLLSEDGSNWYQRRNGYEWDEEGIYTNDHLTEEYAKWSAGEESIVIGRQRFDIGNENISLDITDVFNKFISGELENNGIGIAFSPDYEREELKWSNYVGFLTDKTPTFFEPFVETTYDDYVSDDRGNFALNKKNRLYLFATIGGELQNLDEIPTCKIIDQNDEVVAEELEVKQQSKGIYYIETMFSSKEFEADTQFYDVWSNIQYDGVVLDDVEMDFTTQKASSWFKIGGSVNEEDSFTPTLSGINENEKIRRGDIRKIIVNNRIKYTQKEYQDISGVEIRLYVMDGKRELTVVDFQPLNMAYNENYFVLDTNILLPQTYHVDIKIKYGMNDITHHDVLKFHIVNELNNKYY